MTSPETGVALAVGVFDGVHRGHQALIHDMVQYARDANLRAICLTFDPDPAQVLQPDQPHLALSGLDERVARLRALGVAHVEVVQFSEAFSTQTPDEFIHWVLQRFPLRALWVGAGFALGKGRTGSIEKLEVIGNRLGYRVCVVDPIEYAGRTISSTWIRSMLAEGDLSLVEQLLGEPYRVSGEVVSGARRGRELGFPTANVVPPTGRMLPADGVYFVRVQVRSTRGEVVGGDPPDGGSPDGGSPDLESIKGRGGLAAAYYGVANLGGRPTFGETERLIEAHLLDFSGDLYGARLDVSFLRQLRGVQRFTGLDALRDQIGRDVAAARELMKAAG